MCDYLMDFLLSETTGINKEGIKEVNSLLTLSA
jgi:hypothetical protein